MVIDIALWMKHFLLTLNQSFENRVWFVGLQGSYGRGEATGNKSTPEGKISFGGTDQDLLLGLNRRATRKPKKMAAVIPPAAAVSPPVKAPATPRSSTAFATPCARV